VLSVAELLTVLGGFSWISGFILLGEMVPFRTVSPISVDHPARSVITAEHLLRCTHRGERAGTHSGREAPT